VRLLIYEHVSGGGFADEAIPANVLSEGFGMLRSLISDFKASGHSVTTFLDSRIARLNPPIDADCVVPVFSSQDARANICKILESVDAAYVIAPETDGLLQSLVELVEQTGAVSLNCKARTVGKVSDKAFVYDFLKKLGVRMPETLMFSLADDLEEIKKAIRGRLNFPLIFKPSNGVSCCGLSVVRNKDQIAGAIGKIRKESSSMQFAVQEFIKGADVSVSVFSAGTEALSVSLNQQGVMIEAPEGFSSYTGGVVPFEHPLRAEAFEVAEKIVKAFRDLRGYVGVDLVLAEEEAVAIEVNARLTTSYVGLRRVASFNPAQAIINAVLKRELPTDIQNCGYACFSQVKMPNPTISALQKTYGMNEVVSPPFSVSESGVACSLIASHGFTLEESKLEFREAEKRVLSIHKYR
jgi:predicted ATP-grasp superfamily ATP-dependent carboligase